MTSGGPSYATAGVDIAAAERAVDLMRAAVARTARPEVVGGIGGFAGLFDASKLAAYRRPLLATSTDGVGTKVMIAQRLGRYDTIGIDLVAMVADDLVVCGAEPLFMTDYLVFGKVLPERVAAIVTGIAVGCLQAGCALVGGETAEHPGHLGPADFDIAGAATGVVEADELLGADRVRTGDAVIAMASSGLHANGFSLVRDILARTGMDLADEPPELGGTLGAELATPSRIYAPACLALARAHWSMRSRTSPAAGSPRTWPGCSPRMRMLSSTGGRGVRRRSSGCSRTTAACRAAWRAQAMEQVFNLGVGMTAVVAQEETAGAMELLASHSVQAWIAGEIVPGTGQARLTGSYAT